MPTANGNVELHILSSYASTTSGRADNSDSSRIGRAPRCEGYGLGEDEGDECLFWSEALSTTLLI